MDLTVTDWLVSTEDADIADAARLADAGEAILRGGPHLSVVVEAECHLRLGVLRRWAEQHDLAARHAVHVCGLVADAPTEVQLHTLPRALAVLRSSAVTMVDVSPTVIDAIARGELVAAAAMRTSIEAADRSVVRYAVLAALRDAVPSGPERARIDESIAAVALELESSGEQGLADDANRRTAVNI